MMFANATNFYRKSERSVVERVRRGKAVLFSGR